MCKKTIHKQQPSCTHQKTDFNRKVSQTNEPTQLSSSDSLAEKANSQQTKSSQVKTNLSKQNKPNKAGNTKLSRFNSLVRRKPRSLPSLSKQKKEERHSSFFPSRKATTNLLTPHSGKQRLALHINKRTTGQSKKGKH